MKETEGKVDNMQRWVEDTRMDVLVVNGQETIIVPFCSFFL
jgi:hypothetical protein